MVDCHYDLLTHILMRKDNKQFLMDYCKNVYCKRNITGGIFNLFYMSTAEMKDEIGIEEEEIDPMRNLKEAKEFIESNRLISEDTKYILGIEGLDYLEKIDDIDILYSLGLRAVTPVWNNKNKFGGGTRADISCGLTKLGETLVRKLVDKKIAIDLSHANETTFFDIISLCKKLLKEGKEPIVLASHSNAKAICNVPRNLTDEQILSIRDLGGLIGVVSIKPFCVETTDYCNPQINYRQKYIEHINYIKKLLGSIENIALSTDDMKYYYINPEYYQNINVYDHATVRRDIEADLTQNGYSDSEIEQILRDNFKNKIIKRL